MGFLGILDDLEQKLFYILCRFIKNSYEMKILSHYVLYLVSWWLLDCNPIVQQCFPYLMYPIIPKEVSFKHGGARSRAKWSYFW